MYALNLNHSSENHIFWVRADPIMLGAGEASGTKRRVPTVPPESQTASRCTTAGEQPGERRARALGGMRKEVPEYVCQYKKRCTNGRVAGDGERYAAMVSDDVSVMPTERRSPRFVVR